ncbi:MAG TPA: inositol monophosphatase [Cyanobacteria bacterium UBA8803]|nr:inositol monophosphatase [Cyanobacteria bacterium UBA9273]HBL58327.1 inositol monophosphatase [Cyanobacteria bacterium UBA8803]
MVNNSDLEKRYLAACAVARDAGKLALGYFENVSQVTVEFLAQQNVKSTADREVEEFIVTSLAKSFPEDGFLAEERGGVAGSKLWVIDPIDGTANFIHGIPFFCVSIAYVVEGEVEIGVIYDPVADELFAARRGFGATCNSKAIRVSDCQDIAKAIVSCDVGYGNSIERSIKIIQQFLEAQCHPRCFGAGALAIAHVAQGRYDGYWHLHHCPWDALAGWLVVREAGGWVSDFLADEGLTKGNAILVCTPGIKDFLIAATGIR